jgi:hypothetical protein
MSKEMYIDSHEQLIQEFMEKFPDADYFEAYDKCADKAYDRYRDNFADLVDQARQRKKDEQL